MTWLRREDLEDQELHRLAPCATPSRDSGGRRRPEAEDPLRTCFQRDRDRIIHCTAFRRLQHKTQVFAAHTGDHYRSRMTHSLEVSQMARGASIALRLNPDLAEAIALAHDLGHPPFGHVGERALHEFMADDGGFRHNAQGTRIVDQLEDKYGHGHGLNLTLALRRSLLKGAVPDGFPLSPDLRPHTPPPLEGVLVDHCDKIAYLCHDLDDALRAGLIDAGEAAELRLWQDAAARTDSGRTARVHSEMVAILMHDLVEASDRSITDATSGKRPTVGHSGAIRVQADELLGFLRERFYRAPRVLDDMERGAHQIRSVCHRLLDDPDDIPEPMRARAGDCSRHRLVCDYVAGMTDRFLMRQVLP